MDLTADGEYLNLYCSSASHCMYTVIVIHEYKTKLTTSYTKLTASEEEQKELLRVLEQTKRMAYARDQQILTLESDGQVMIEKCEC